MLIVGHRHLERTLRDYVAHYDAERPHGSLTPAAPDRRPPEARGQPPAEIGRGDVLGGVLHKPASLRPEPLADGRSGARDRFAAHDRSKRRLATSPTTVALLLDSYAALMLYLHPPADAPAVAVIDLREGRWSSGQQALCPGVPRAAADFE